jgi:predicted SnoaL-like aldol condensation-catalyzing enzyme
MNLRTRAIAYHEAVSSYKISTVKALIHEDYIQHNPRVATGRSAFLNLIPRLEEFGSKIENIRLICDGDFVAMHHVWKNATPFGASEMVAFHIVRFDEDELIAEHWNVMSTLNSDNPLANSPTNGNRQVLDLHATNVNKKIISDHVTLIIKDGVSSPNKPRYDVIHKILGEGNFVLCITEGHFMGLDMALYDLFELKSEGIIDRWHVFQQIPSSGVANTNTMFNFP